MNASAKASEPPSTTLPGTMDEDLQELILLARVQNYDLFGFLLALENSGTALFGCEIDEAAKSAAGHLVCREQLPKEVSDLLAAMRAHKNQRGGG